MCLNLMNIRPLLLASVLIMASCSSVPPAPVPTPPHTPTPVVARAYTLKDFGLVSAGMTLEQVEAKIGKGKLVSKSAIAGKSLEIWQWANQDGGNITIDFLDGKVNSVNQFNLPK